MTPQDRGSAVDMPTGAKKMALMSRVNGLLTLLSLTTVVITIERASPTTSVVLQPYSFLNLHAVVQMGLITAFSVILSFLILREVSRNFRDLQDSRGAILGCLFLLGAYFYATGNGAHEVSGFVFSHFCGGVTSVHPSCHAMYLDDYFFGNAVYFVGLALSSLAIVLVELRWPRAPLDVRNRNITLANAAVLALTFVAYDSFDRVWVGLISTVIFAMMFSFIWLRSGVRLVTVPFTTYSAVGFTMAAVIAIPLRLLR
jgi:hypothetical protein